MSGVEVIAIIACVAGVISAFNDGSKILRQIKKRRAKKKVLQPPVLLEQSLQSAPQDIEREKELGVARCGQAFAIGDDIAVIALQKITIELQTVLLHQLIAAHEDDQVTDFTPVVNTSDHARDETIWALMQLRARLHQAAPILELAHYGNFAPASAASSVDPLQDRKGKRRSTSGSFRDMFKLRFLDTSTPRTIAAPQSGNSNHVVQKGDNNQIYSQSPYLANQSPHVPLQIEELGEDTNEIWETERLQRADSGPVSPFAILGQTTSTQTSNGSSSQLSPAHSLLVPLTSPSNLLRPTRENDYLGFCKGAWKMQNCNEKAMRKVSDWGSFTGAPTYFACSSSKCAFADRVGPKRIGKSVNHGIKCRSAFLTKSHVAQARIENGRYSFRCIFCAFSGQPTPIIRGTDNLFGHLATHRGEVLGEALLDRTRCINNRVAEDDEDFDINLLPLGYSHSDRQSSVRSEDLIDLSSDM